MSVILNILLFVLILGVIVFIHEFGHFIFAKITGVYVYEFAIGMGPKILSKKSKKTGIVYSIRALPVGGFVSMVGEDEENERDDSLNKKPVSTTHVRDNEEHTDWKDIRLYMETFYKQNLNFLEILFTDYRIINPAYIDKWKILIEHREEIARMNPYRAVKSMQGIAKEKYHAMEHRYPSKADIIDAYGYDGKQVHHLMRVDDYLERYIAGERYEACLRPTSTKVPRMMDYKMLDKISLEEAREEALHTLMHVDAMANAFCEEHEDKEDPEMRELLQDVCYDIMEIAVRKELEICRSVVL